MFAFHRMYAFGMTGFSFVAEQRMTDKEMNRINENKRVCGQNLSNVSLDLRKTKHTVENLNCHSMDCQQKLTNEFR